MTMNFLKNKKQYENKRLNSSINTNNYRMFKFINSISTGKNNIKPGILYKVAKKFILMKYYQVRESIMNF